MGYWRRRMRFADLLCEATNCSGVAAYAAAVAMAQAGAIDEAFTHLDRMVAQRAGQCAFLKVDPSLDPLHGDERWLNILRRVGLSDPLPPG